MDRDLLRSVNDGPRQPMVLVPRVPATTDTAEIPAYHEKKTSNFTEEETKMMENDSKVVRLLIMAIPNDIFQELDSCVTAKKIWDQKFGVTRTKEENNVLFLKSLNEEWSQLSMSIQGNQNLESWSLTDIYGTLVAQEKEVDLDSDDDINAFAKSLALITHQFNKKFGKKVFEGRSDDKERRGNPEKRF
ncbi:hypothetical protein L6452_22039 [Arctium lappa]|uniref:Uncharacterized protein n=1 Tax=Arctium lappa TaxID=4217 RepID=A0ACB9AXU0_ARCLA|nr:hypothetical protein L6452_22039 [Arctium lappa]